MQVSDKCKSDLVLVFQTLFKIFCFPDWLILKPRTDLPCMIPLKKFDIFYKYIKRLDSWKSDLFLSKPYANLIPLDLMKIFLTIFTPTMFCYSIFCPNPQNLYGLFNFETINPKAKTQPNWAFISATDIS